MEIDPGPVVVFAPDLLLRQQVVEGLKAAGITTRGAATRARFEAAVLELEPAVVVIELDGAGVDGPALVADLVDRPVHVLGFCAHTRADLIRAVRTAGAHRVVARGEIVLRAAKIVRELAART